MSDPRLKNEPSFNPYAAPHASISMTDAPWDNSTQPVHLFSASGRIGRLRYICWTYVYGVVAVLLSLIVLAVMVLTTVGTSIFTVHDRESFLQELSNIGPVVIVIGIGLIALILIASFVACILLMIQRSHDMGWSGWSILILFAVMIGAMFVAGVLSIISPVLTGIVAFFAALTPYIWYVKPGTPGTNRFGSPPSPTPMAVQIFAWIFVACIAVQFLLNIVRIVASALRI